MNDAPIIRHQPKPRAMLADRESRWYFAGQAAYFASGGIQNMLFAWLVTIALHKPAELVGLAQMASMMPMPLLLLFGGAAADRRDLRIHLIRMQLMMLVPQSLLLGTIALDLLSYEALIVYVLMVGSIGAFVMPARDAALPFIMRKSGADFSRGIAMATSVQFGGQIFGLGLGGLASEIGPLPLIAVMMALVSFTAFSTHHLSQIRPSGQRLTGNLTQMLHEIREGVVEAWTSVRIRTVLVNFFVTSILFMGVFMVLVPVMVRDVYDGSSQEMSFANISFMVGVMIATTVILNTPPIERQGRAMMIAMIGSWLSFVILYFGPPQPVFYLAFMMWGCAGGISMSMSRSIVQSSAPESHQARISSIYQLAMMGGGPIGALASGFLIKEFGVLNAILFPIVCISIWWFVMLFVSPIWSIKRIPHEPAPEELKASADAAPTTFAP